MSICGVFSCVVGRECSLWAVHFLGVGQPCSAAGSGALRAQDLWKVLSSCLHNSLISGQTTRRDHSSSHQQKIELNIYWAWPRPSEQMFPQSVSPIRKLPKASYPYLSEGRQNENHSHRELIKLITWTTTLCNSMKLQAKPCRAIQDGCVMVEILTKRGPLEKGMANHFNILALRTLWTVWKGEKIWHWKMNSPGLGAQYATGEEPRHIPCSILNHSVVPYRVLMVAN